MNKTIEYFEKNGYVVLKDALSKEECTNLTNYMFDLYNKGETVKDSQCPLSDAIYGAPLFDQLLQKFAKPIGDAVGKTLLPTYTYSRIYRPGEILKRHKDRPSCEISATMTLGYDSKPIWPIIFDENKEVSVDLDVGELAIYKGCDIVHWRDAFKGQWHVQVFLHYVDANGPHKNHFRDGRETFGTKKIDGIKPTPDGPNKSLDKPMLMQNDIPNKIVHLNEFTNVVINKPNFEGVMIPNSDLNFPGYHCIDKYFLPELRFTSKECDRIVSISKSHYPSTASVGGDISNSKLDKNTRSAKIYNIENNLENKWIFEKVANVVSIMNKIHFNYEILGITHSLQLIEYDSNYPVPGHYNWHIDAGKGQPSTRKISFTAQLTDPAEYEGCELIINNLGHEIIGTKEKGSIHLFPSFLLHKVTPITKGIRYALVIWIHGSEKFR